MPEESGEVDKLKLTAKLDNRVKIKAGNLEIEVESKEKSLIMCIALAEGIISSFVEKEGKLFYEKGKGFKVFKK